MGHSDDAPIWRANRKVAALSGGLLAPHLADTHQQLIVLITSYGL